MLVCQFGRGWSNHPVSETSTEFESPQKELALHSSIQPAEQALIRAACCTVWVFFTYSRSQVTLTSRGHDVNTLRCKEIVVKRSVKKMQKCPQELEKASCSVKFSGFLISCWCKGQWREDTSALPGRRPCSLCQLATWKCYMKQKPAWEWSVTVACARDLHIRLTGTDVRLRPSIP